MNTTSSISTHRRFARQKIETLVYADLGAENGGFPINVSEDGMAFQGVRPLEKHATLNIKFKLPGITGSMAGTAEVVWLNESKKGGGLRFIEMPEESRRLIATWLLSRREPSSSAASQSAENTNNRRPRNRVKGSTSAPAIPIATSTSDSSERTDSASSASRETVSTQGSVSEVVSDKPTSTVPVSVESVSVERAPAERIVEIGAPQTQPIHSAAPAAAIYAPEVPQVSAPPPVPTPQVPSVAEPPRIPTSVAAAKTEAYVWHAVALPDPRESMEWAHPTPARPPALVASDELRAAQNSWITPFGLGAALAVGVMLICGAIVWQFRTNLFPELAAERSARQEILPIGGEATTQPTGPSIVAEPARKKSKPVPTGSNEFAAEQENQRSQELPNATQYNQQQYDPSRTDSRPSISQQPPIHANADIPSQPPINTAAVSSSVPAVREPAVVPAQSAATETANPQPIATPATSQPPAQAAAPVVKAPEPPPLPTGSVEVISDPYPSIRVPPELKAQGARPGVSIHIGRLVSKVDPVYPTDALQQKTAGTVKLHVVIDRNGGIESAQLADGSGGVLADAARRAIQQWHYEPTVLDRTPIEAEEDITVVFRIVTPSSR